jgi:uncharacterized protein (TIGR00297 family)
VTISAAEWKRKAVHAGMGLFALALRWLSWPVAALCALAAVLFNLFVMPRIGRSIYRQDAGKRDVGIVAYPVMVLVLILLFRYELAAAAALWAMMALGDPAATIAGKTLGGPGLPWNRKKRWAGLLAYILVGGAACVGAWLWVTPGSRSTIDLRDLTALLLPVVVLAAFLESLDTGLDDNWVPPIPCALLLAFLYMEMSSPRLWSGLPMSKWVLAIAVNAAIALVTGTFGIVSVSGAVAGGIAGTLILALGGWPRYAVLWGFFLFGTLATRLGYQKKKEQGTEQEGKGRRGVRHVVANCGVAALLCVLSFIALGPDPRLALAYAAAFAAALADTLGTEVGSLYGRQPISLLSARAVAPGTRGAVSLPGLAAGLAGAGVIGLLAVIVGLIPMNWLWVVAAAGLAGSVFESLLSDLGRLRGFRVEHEFANAFNTFVGAVAALEISTWLHRGFVSLPFDWRGI